jgi:hypothetical protein
MSKRSPRTGQHFLKTKEIKEMKLLRALGMKISEIALLYGRNENTVQSSTFGYESDFPAQNEWAQRDANR